MYKKASLTSLEINGGSIQGSNEDAADENEGFVDIESDEITHTQVRAIRKRLQKEV